MILNDKGIPIFHYGFGESPIDKYNYQLIASYFDQICRFTKYGFNESLNTLKMDKSVFYFYTHPHSNLHLILKCDGQTDENRSKKTAIDKCASIILEKFFVKYANELKTFKGNITPFKSFSEELDSLLNSKGDLKPSLLKPEVV
jgi:hypothetical protein